MFSFRSRKAGKKELLLKEFNKRNEFNTTEVASLKCNNKSNEFHRLFAMSMNNTVSFYRFKQAV